MIDSDIASDSSPFPLQEGQPGSSMRLDAWRLQFIDDLVAANRLKTFLVGQGNEIPQGLLEGLADLSERYRAEVDSFIEGKRRMIWQSFIDRMFRALVNRSE